MKKIIKVFLIFLFVGICFQKTFACSCEFHSHKRDFRKAVIIFEGTVLDVRQDFSLDSPIPKDIKDFQAQITEHIKLSIDKSWKGNKKSEVEVWSLSYPYSCGGFRFTKGEKYLVYVFKAENGSLYAVTSCGRTRKFETNDEDRIKEIKQLDSFWFRFMARLNPFKTLCSLCSLW